MNESVDFNAGDRGISNGNKTRERETPSSSVKQVKFDDVLGGDYATEEFDVEATSSVPRRRGFPSSSTKIEDDTEDSVGDYSRTLLNEGFLLTTPTQVPSPILSNAGSTPRLIKTVERARMEQRRLDCMNKDKEKMIQMLAEGKVTLTDNCKETDGWNLMMFATSTCSVPLVKFLIDNGVNVNFEAPGNGNRLSALMVCTLAPKKDMDQVLEVASMLIKAGANVNHSDSRGITTLMVACKENMLKFVELLLTNGADVNQVDLQGRTALELASKHGLGKIIRILLEHHADVKLDNNDGQIPCDVAREAGYNRLADILYQIEITKWTPNQGKENHPPWFHELNTMENSWIKDGLTTKPSPDLNVVSHGKKRSQIQYVLENLRLGEYMKNFEAHNISYLQFLNLSETDLKEIGISSVGARLKILDIIRDIHNREWEEKSITPQLVMSDITSCDIIHTLNNTKKQMDYISATIAYLHSKAMMNGSSVLNPGSTDQTPPVQQVQAYLTKCEQSLTKLRREVKEPYSVLIQLNYEAGFQIPDPVAVSPSNDRSLTNKILNSRFVSTAAVIGIGIALLIKFRSKIPSLGLIKIGKSI